MKWIERVAEYELFFSTAKLPETITFNDCETIIDMKLFVSTHLEYVKHNRKKSFLPYLYRLHLLKQHIEKTHTNLL